MILKIYYLIAKKFVDYEFDREELFSNVRLQRFDKYEDIVYKKKKIINLSMVFSINL